MGRITKEESEIKQEELVERIADLEEYEVQYHNLIDDLHKLLQEYGI